MSNKSNEKSRKRIKQRHRFFLSPYEDLAFTKCPKCDNKTKVRKIPLVIHIDPHQLFILNKNCKYCPYCDLIIAKKAEVEGFMAAHLEIIKPELIGNNYVVFGTVDRKDWKETMKQEIYSNEMIDRVYVFKDVWNFEVIPAGWYPADE